VVLAALPLFHELSALPYVTMTLLDTSSAAQDAVYFGQGTVEKQCMSQLARNYTWTLAIDADEYLWFDQYMDVKEFLEQHVNYTYLSFGKWMYTPRYKVAPAAQQQQQHDTEQALFGGLNYHAFTGKSYCYTGGADVCPTWTGRCKVMARPLRSHWRARRSEWQARRLAISYRHGTPQGMGHVAGVSAAQ
jgi:hypothetical protein